MDVQTREMAATIAASRGITQEQAERLIAGAEGFWGALGELGFVDGFGGSEFDRIFPEVVEAIHRLANPLAHGGV
jgi:hypothetical protein